MQVDRDELNRSTVEFVDAMRKASLIAAFTPTNLAEVRSEYLASHHGGPRRNPVLRYGSEPDGVSDGLDAAERALPAAQPWRDLLATELAATRQTWAALRSRDADEMTADSVRRYGVPDRQRVAEARTLLAASDATSADATMYSSAVAAHVMAEVLSRLGLDEWSVDVRLNMAARMSVVGARRVVRVRDETTFTEAELRRLAVHEVGTHAVRWVNSLAQPLRLLAVALASHAYTDEGLAVWHERRAGVATVDVERRYALRYLACEAALRGDFWSVVDALTPHATPAEVFEIAIRVKRGLVDTSEPGGYLKDQVYFRGAIDVSEHLAGNPDDLALLMSSRWPIAQTPLLRELREHGHLLPSPARVGITDLVTAALAGVA